MFALYVKQKNSLFFLVCGVIKWRELVVLCCVYDCKGEISRNKWLFEIPQKRHIFIANEGLISAHLKQSTQYTLTSYTLDTHKYTRLNVKSQKFNLSCLQCSLCTKTHFPKQKTIWMCCINSCVLYLNFVLHHMTRPGSILRGVQIYFNCFVFRHALESGLFPLS